MKRKHGLLVLLLPLLMAATPVGPVTTRPPQFVIASFDGAGSVDLWQRWRDVARKNDAHFTFFLSGVYLLEPEHGREYLPPDRKAGVSSIGFLPVPKGAQPEATLRALLEQIALAQAEGHEIGTHFCGHFCGDHGAGVWDAEDWRAEIDEFRALLRNVDRNNGLVPPSPVVLSSASIIGARVPCLDADRKDLESALASTGFRYDASRPGVQGEWPRRESGVWSFPIPPLFLAGSTHPVLATDYNLWAHQGEVEEGADTALAEQQTYQALVSAFDQSYYGKRAPFSVGSHFERWNHEAYLGAFTRFLHEVCGRPEVRCQSFAEVVDWLDALPPGELDDLRQGDFPRMPRLQVAGKK